MFCGNCGTELTEGAKFCPNCGAPAPAVVEERETDTPGPESARPRRRLAAPLVTALVVLALATTSSAAYLVYALVIAPLPPRGEQGADAPAEEGEGASEQGADAEEPAATEEAPAAEPEPEPEPAVTHDYECDYFYVDVPDAWQTGTILEEGEGSWNFAHPEGQYVNATVLTTDPNPMSGHQWLVGTTSDGTRIWGNDAATGFFGEGKGTIALK